MSNKKYMLAGSIAAGACVLYASQQYGLDSGQITEVIEKNKNKFTEVISELAEFALEILEKFLLIIKKLIMELIFKAKMVINKI